MADIYKLRIPCPSCGKLGVRVVIEDDEDTRVICIQCKKVDVVVCEEDAWTALSAITEVIDITPEEITDVLVEKLHLEED